MKKTVYLSFVLFLCAVMPGMAQQESFVPPLDQMVSVPASPEAAAFAKYGNTPVSQFTGTPSISIPLAQIQGRAASLPVSITYDASGIKVEQIASWVGLGWNLNVGGAVTRQVNGLPDDYLSAYPLYYPHYSTASPDSSWPYQSGKDMKYYIDYYRDNTMHANTHPEHTVDVFKHFIDAYNNSEIDTEPDTYSFSAMGISGTILVDYSNGTAECLNNPQYKVEPQLGLADSGNKNSRLLEKWVITDNMGNKYTFDQADTTYLDDYGVNDGYYREYHSAWYLTKFESTNGQDVFEFVYGDAVQFTNDQQLAGTASIIPGASNPLNEYAPLLQITQAPLESVKVNGKERLKLLTTSRDDLEGRERLNRIHVLDLDGGIQDVIALNHSYFDDGVVDGTDLEHELRLKLDDIEVWGADSLAKGDNDLVKKHSFDYYHQFTIPQMPARTSLAQDFWGYYNNQNSNNSLIPESVQHNHTGYYAAKRHPSTAFALEGTLDKITYPTGGTTEFFYQGNRDGEGDLVGGFRVYKIVDRPDTNTVAQTRYFYYDELAEVDLGDLDDDFFRLSDASSGELQVPADFVHQSDNRLYSYDPQTQSGSWNNGTQTRLLGSNRYRMRSAIVTYSKVTEVQFSDGNTNGFTVYEFNNLNDASTSKSTTSAPLNGRTKNTRVYDDRMKLLQKKEFEFSVKTTTAAQGYQLKSERFQHQDGAKTQSGSDYYIAYSDMNTTGIDPYVEACFNCLLKGPTNKYAPKPFTLQSHWVKLDSETTTVYTDVGEMTNTTSYTYDTQTTPDHYEVLSTQTTDSEGNAIYTAFTYPQDLVSGTNIYYYMEQDNRTGQVVKTVTKKGGANGLVLQEQETTFSGGSSAQRPQKLRYASNGGSLEDRISFDSYDLDGNPLELTKDGVENIQYLWDMNNSLPTATVTGTKATFSGGGISSTITFAYSSFETDEKGGWTYTGSTSAQSNAPSGAKVYNLNGGTLTRSELEDDFRYIVAFWAKGTGSVKLAKTKGTTTTNETQAVTSTWTYYQFEVSDIDKVVLSENAGADNIDIDELRIHRKGSLMTTYAYDNKGRLVSQVGPNGMPMHYEYDMHGRLLRIKDHEFNTLRLMNYEFKNSTN